MKTIRFEIKDNADRMAMFEALNHNDYFVTIKTDTSYMPPKTFMYVDVEDYEVGGEA